MTPIHFLLDDEDGTEPHHAGAVCVLGEFIWLPESEVDGRETQWTLAEALDSQDEPDLDGELSTAAWDARKALRVFDALDRGAVVVDLNVEADLEWERRCAASDRRHDCPASAVAWRV